MATSEARIQANQRNAQLSTGPRTTQGKEQSRRNGLKHGMSGQGVVLPDEDEQEVQERFEGFHADLRPKTQLGGFLAHRLAFLSVRIERCERQEARAISSNMRNAPAAFDRERLAMVDDLMASIALNPSTNVRRLRLMPEGIDRMIEELNGLMSDLVHPTKPIWDEARARKLDDLLGRQFPAYPNTLVGSCSNVLRGDPSFLGAIEAECLSPEDQKSWAREQLIEVIEIERETLRALRPTLDTDLIDQDRAEAPTRAIFDPGKEACLARRYEATAERIFFKTLNELRAVEKAAVEVPVIEESVETAEPLGSSCQEGEEAIDDPSPIEYPTSMDWDRSSDRAWMDPMTDDSRSIDRQLVGSIGSR